MTAQQRKKMTRRKTIAPKFNFSRAIKSIDTYLLIALLALLLFHAQRGWVTTKDDAFITFRYAEHLAQGHGLVWNIGEEPVEGYTNFLFLLIMALFALFKANLVLASKVINLLSAVAIFFMLIEIFNRIFRDRYLLFFGLFLFAFPYFTSAHIAAGLETMFYAMLVTLSSLLLLRQIELYSRKRQIALAITMLSLGLTRPEGVLVAALLIVIELILVKEARSRRSVMVIALWYFLPAALYMAGRVWYFHFWFPNPFYIKKSDQFFSLVGLMELQEFILVTSMFVGVVLISFITEKIRKPLLVLAAVFVPSLAVYMFFRPMMNYAYRYYQPYYPIMLPVLAAPLFVAKNFAGRLMTMRRFPARVKKAVPAILLAAAVFLLCPYVSPYAIRIVNGELKLQRIGGNYFEFKYWRQQGTKLERCHIYIGKILERFPEFRDRFIALGDAGAIPYYSKWKVIDLGGLNDVHLAHHGQMVSRRLEVFSTKLDLDYIFKKDPSIVIVASTNPITIDHYASRVLHEDPRFRRYERAMVFEYSPLIFEIIYFKKGDPKLAWLRQRFEEAASMDRDAQKIMIDD